jgi:GxxExxY protein
VVVDAAIAVHSELGPGLLESTYEACLAYEIGRRGIAVRTQVPLPIRYKGIRLEAGYRVDLLLDTRVIVELKAVETILPVHMSQLLGYLLNFNVKSMKDGIKRVVNNYSGTSRDFARLGGK